jgi:hypothetical protein
LTLEPLEGRALLSLTTWTVNSLGDTGTGTGTSGDLRYVITQADQTQGDNTINFAVTGQITLNSALPDLSNTTGLMDIEGPGASSLTVARSSAAAADFRIFTVDANVQAQLVGLTITRGRANAYYGGGIDNGGTLTVADSSVIGNSVLIYSGGFTGGGIENESGATLTVTNSIVGYNSVPIGGQGGGISNDGTMTVTNSSIDNNSAPSSFASGGSGGAGIINLGTLTVTNSTIDNNSAGAGGGGGIGNNGTLTVTGSTIANNSAAAGGGILNDSLEGSMTVTNSTIAGNSATATSFNPGDGGGIWDFNGPLTVTNSTIADNNVPSGGLGGGLDDGSTTAILDNTIVAINTSGGATPNDIAGTVSSTSAYNLVGIGGSGGLVNGINGNQVGVADPGLSRLADNGGSTETIALLTGSPAIDKGSNALVVDPTTGQPLTTDQRGPGFPRIVNGTVDIGAYEFQTTSSLAVTTQPPASVAAGSSFGLSVTAKDSSGNVDTSFTGTVTVALGSNPVDGILGGTLSATAQSGVASFLDLTLDKVGTGYTLLVSATGLDGATTNDITVTPAAVTQLVVTSQPPPAVAPDSAFGLVVAACDPFGNVDTSFSGSVAVALLNNPGGATLGGTLSVTAQGGVATFSDLTLNELGFGYTLSVSYSGLTTATTNAFNVTTTTWTVNSLGDTGTGSGTSGDLRYVITQADQTPGDNTINFAVTGTITLNSALPDLSNTSGLIDIEGPGASSLTVSRGAAAGTPDFGILTVDAFVQARLAGLTITGGSASSGGGIDNAGTLTVTNSTIDNNSVPIEGSGGGIYNGGTLTVTNSTIDNNSASFDGFGGGIENDATLIVTNSTIDNNLAGWGGGGIGNRGTLTVTNSTVGDNSATGEFIGRPGGGIYNYGGTLTVTDSTIAYNSAAGDGGGIGNNGTLTVTNSTIAYNVAGGGGGGGGGGVANSGTLTVTNSTIAYNSAYGGGGIYNNAGTLTVTDSTIAYNSCNLAGQPVVVEGGGLAIGGGSTATLENTIVAVNTSGSAATSNDIALYSGGTVSSTSAYNLIGVGGSGGLVNGTNGNQVGVAHPGLDPNGLQNNGGPTQTIALLPGSPAIDAGSNALAVDPTTGLPLTTDQRGAGLARIVNGTVDIGAFEVQATNHLAVTAQPPGSVTAGAAFGLTVTAEDKSGNVLTSFNGTVTVELDNNSGGATLGGTLSVTAQSGVASFSDLTLDKAATGYTLLVSATGLAGATTAAINVTPAAASQLVVSSQPPSSVLVGSGFGLVVTAEDPFDNVDTNFGGSVAVALLNNPGSATLGGTPSVTAEKGVATFSGLTLNEPGIGYTLSVSSSGLSAATTNPFNVTVPQLVVTAQPPASVIPGSGFGLTVTAEDSSGNMDSSFNGTVAVALTNNPGGATLGGTLSVTAINGVATFSGLTLNKLGVGYTLTVSSSSLSAATTNPFNVTLPQLVVTAQPPTSVLAGSGFGLTVTAEDSSGNVDTSFNDTVTVALTNNPGGATLGGTPSVTAQNGVATFSGLTLNEPGTGYTLSVSSSGLTTVTTSAFNVIVPSTWTVNSLGDTGAGTGNAGDLRYVITQADKTQGDNTINFAVTGTITLNSALPDLSNTTGLMAIEGPGANNLTVNGNNEGTVFTVDANTQAELAGLTITGGDSAVVGGGIENSGILTVSSCVITGNSAVDNGGGINNNYGKLTVVTSTVTDNSCAYLGAGIASSGTVTISNSTISSNHGAGYGGGILNYYNTLTVSNSTIADNSATQSGGGIWSSGTSTVINSSIAYNSSGSGGGIENSSTVTLENTIVALNTGGEGANDISGSSMSSSSAYNLIGTGGSGGLVDGVNGNEVGVANPGLATLADNGGPTQTIALLPGSPAIDAGSNALAVDPTTGQPLTTDQRGPGYARVVNGTVDIGAFEVQATNHLTITTQPPDTATAGAGFGFTVTAEDASGNVLTSFDGTVTVALENNPGNATLGGTLTAASDNGVATFSGLTIDQATNGYTLFVSANSVAATVTSAVNVTPAAASQLIIITQPPGSVVVSSGFGLTVSAEDPYGNVDTSFSGSVNVALSTNPGGATLSGTLTETAQSGVANFSGLTIDKGGNSYTLLVTANGLTSAETSAFNVLAASQLAITTQPPTGVVVGSGFGLVVTVEDQFGDVFTNYNGTVTVALSSNPGAATLGGTLTATAQNGMANFSGLTLNQIGVGYTLAVSSGGLTPATTSAFNVQTTVGSSVGVNWGTAGSATLETASDGLRLLPAGRNTDMPWLGINRVQITLTQPATLAAGDITVIGSSGTNYGPVTVSGSGTSYTITLAQPIDAADRVTITIGNVLIAPFTRRLDVLPGDVNDDGVVNVQDLVAIRNQMLGLLGTVPTIFGDINGDGKVDINDYIAVRKLIGTHL